MNRRAKILVAVGLALVIAVALIAASALAVRGGESEVEVSGPVLPGAAELAVELRGIPQENNAIGRRDAPVTLVEYADMQCPFCAQWALGTFRDLLDDYVRPGNVRVEFRGIAFIGPDSERAVRAVYAAGQQGRLWSLAEILFSAQGAENSGWASDELLRGAARGVPGLDVARLMNERNSAAVGDALERAAAEAERDGINSTPSFLIGKTGGDLERLQVTSLDAAPFREAIEGLLAR